jgi:hypothetical protein
VTPQKSNTTTISGIVQVILTVIGASPIALLVGKRWQELADHAGMHPWKASGLLAIYGIAIAVLWFTFKLWKKKRRLAHRPLCGLAKTDRDISLLGL